MVLNVLSIDITNPKMWIPMVPTDISEDIKSSLPSWDENSIS